MRLLKKLIKNVFNYSLYGFLWLSGFVIVWTCYGLDLIINVIKRKLNLIKKLLSFKRRNFKIIELPDELTTESVATDIAMILTGSKLLIQAKRKIRLYCRLNNIKIK